mgnify:CR=1 FL=1
MARIDTLANFLTDVAAAIKSKTGKTGLITPANFDTEILNITTGSGSGSGGDDEETIILPAEYLLLDRLISYGGEHIDTGLLPSATLGFEIDFRISNEMAANSHARSILGCRHPNYYTNAYQLTTYTTLSDGDYGGAFAFGSVSSSSEYRYIKAPGNMNNYRRLKVSLKNAVFTDADGNQTTFTENLTFSDPVTIYLFAYNESDYKASEQSDMTLYRCKFYDGDTLIRDFVPALRRSDDVAGLYDRVEDTFYEDKSGYNGFTY